MRLGFLLSSIMMLIALASPLGGASSSTIRDSERMPSRLLDRDLVFSLYLPPQHPDRSTKRNSSPQPVADFWPLLILLHGHGGNDRDWLHAGKLQETADGLIEAGQIEPLIIVMPDGDNSWYVDNSDPGGAGLIASALIEELPSYLAVHYQASLSPAHTAIAGLSMGGYGALRLGFNEPGRFAAIVSMSGAVFSPEISRAEFSELQLNLFNTAFGDPFDPERFAAASPFNLIPELRASPARPDILLMAGDDDFFALDLETMRLHLALEEAGVASEIRITDGGHVWPLWADHLDPALRFINASFEPDRVSAR
ncbi:MAG: alpha/beta hydrolase family protein [Pseudomonadota bacterium]